MTPDVQTLALLVKAAYRAGMREMNAALADLGLTSSVSCWSPRAAIPAAWSTGWCRPAGSPARRPPMTGGG
jgi:hypothetical protein